MLLDVVLGHQVLLLFFDKLDIDFLLLCVLQGKLMLELLYHYLLLFYLVLLAAYLAGHQVVFLGDADLFDGLIIGVVDVFDTELLV